MRNLIFCLALSATAWTLGQIPAQAQVLPGDPLQSVMWGYVRDEVIGAQSVVFDDRVQVYAPHTVEDGMSVPVSLRVSGLEDIAEIVVVADLNPIPKVLSFEPLRAKPFLAFRLKVQQATPVRAAVRTTDGVWHVGGRWVNAPGGGCTTPSAAQASRLWEKKLNRVSAQVWSLKDGGERLRLRLIHPMDTGLVDNIPAFYLDQLAVRSPDDQVLARLATHEPVAENPVLTLEFDATQATGQGYHLSGRDNDGNRLDARVPPAAAQFQPEPSVETRP